MYSFFSDIILQVCFDNYLESDFVWELTRSTLFFSVTSFKLASCRSTVVVAILKLLLL